MEYDIWYAGVVIGNLVAPDDKEAKRIANKMFAKGKRGSIAVCQTRAEDKLIQETKTQSLIQVSGLTQPQTPRRRKNDR